ncbi:MAG: carbamoyltransferase HypF [Chloroflexota bacterium]
MSTAQLGQSNTGRTGGSRLRVVVHGAVQGVGFRPFVYRLAVGMGLNGWVNNSPQGVFIEVEGRKELLDTFLLRLASEKPPRSHIQSMEPTYLDPVGYSAFEIRASEKDSSGGFSALILPDIATCPDCLRDVFDPTNRRYLYPFTNCTNCGPRFTIIEGLPYDRGMTTMKHFPMCEHCQAEYENPLDRRFHAQPNACPVCGPHLELWTQAGFILATQHDALLAAASAVRDGSIVAVKGLGGFLLVADARSEDAISRLRERKRRVEKPFALMYPSLPWVEEHCEVSDAEARLLTSPESPIVLLKRRWASAEIAPNVAPGSPNLGVMLPYTPLHHLLMAELGFPVVATSGNLSDEPICIDEHDAIERLGEIADVFLVHNRPIARHMDDSIVRVLMGREMVMRRARGYAPLPVRLDKPLQTTLAVGAHFKNSVALAVGQDVFISQHIGDLETTQATAAFKRVIDDFQHLYMATPTTVVCDAHPDYLSTKHAEATGLPLLKVQHHAAHVYACMAENGISGPALGVSWDGTGYGDDGTVWGGEFFRMGSAECGMRNERDGEEFGAPHSPFLMPERIAHLRTFSLPGGESAVKEPRRSAIGLLYEFLGERIALHAWLPALRACTQEEIKVWTTMIDRGLNSPVTSSAGRLFDAVASILGICDYSSYEGQAAMQLENAIGSTETDKSYGFRLIPDSRQGKKDAWIVEWQPTICGVILDRYFGTPITQIAARFHNTLAEMIVAVARLVNEPTVVLTGGCFQNAYLIQRAVRRLQEEGFRPYWHQRVPPNDGGIALGQIVAAAWSRADE